MRLKVPTYMIAMLAITGLYLTVEIPFSIYLVRILGGSATEADIDTVEKFGRLLTGIAIALAYVGIRIYPRYHAYGYSFGASTRQALFRAVPIIVLTYVGLHIYGEVRGMFSTGDARKEAFISNLAKRTISEDGLAGVSPSLDPSWLAAVSGMPALLNSDDLVSLSGQSLDELARREAMRSVGDAETARDAFATELDASMAPAFKQFSSAVGQYRAAVNNREYTAEREWYDFRDRLRTYFGSNVPRPGSSEHARVIRKMREDGLPVSGRFRLDDKAGFMAMVMKKVVREAGSEFSKGVALDVGKGSRLTPDSGKGDFYGDPAVQRLVRERLSMKLPSGLILSPDIELESFRDGVYPALLKRAASEILETANMRGASFTSQVNRETGEAAVKAATLPSTALLLSLAGALFHIHKFSGYLMLIFGTALRSRVLASKPSRHAFAAAALALAVIGMRPAIPSHIEGVLSKSEAGVYGHVVAGAISLQPGMFLIGDTMASFGPWQLIGSQLPAPRHSEASMASVVPSVSDEQTASVVPLPEAKPVQVAEADFVVPIPLPRP
ncbi:hypothetical protein OIU34_24935 [Pararhizobium sp. BT-229]|uniref:hypothetical protein n=1 Tax=Pararhizobium sp. BT-229 TaxID=2986923 RepID=UPI0021F7EBE1|nr:hypothetical protein [Pararhizobium sp. BT-229]MCV9965128.1 hypothetical protein [Pararhizobium sp. BT-229]